MTKEIKSKISRTLKGKIPKNINQIKGWNKGTKGITKANSGSFKKGFIPWNKGLTNHLSKEAIEKIRRASIGRKHTEKWKQETKERLKHNHPNKGKKFPIEIYPNMGLRKTRKNIIFPKKDTSIEIKIQNFLEQLGIDYLKHKYMNINHGYQCDIFIPSMNLVIECDGIYWHSYPIGNEIDHIRTKELLDKGFRVLRLWEFQIKEMDINGFKQKIMEFK